MFGGGVKEMFSKDKNNSMLMSFQIKLGFPCLKY